MSLATKAVIEPFSFTVFTPDPQNLVNLIELFQIACSVSTVFALLFILQTMKMNNSIIFRFLHCTFDLKVCDFTGDCSFDGSREDITIRCSLCSCH